MTSEFAVVDCETTGLESTARIIQIAVVFLDRDMSPQDLFVSYVHGDGTVGSEEAALVHGITPSDIANAPDFSEVLPHIESGLRSRWAFAHYAPFDKEKIDYELSRIDRPPLVHLGCTKKLGELLGYGTLRLSEAKTLFGLEVGRPHDAGSDAISAASVLREYRARHPEAFEAYLHATFEC